MDLFSKTASVWGLQPAQVRALVTLVDERVWFLLKDLIEEISSSAQSELESAEEINKILRAQGKLAGLKTFVTNVETIVREAIEEKENA